MIWTGDSARHDSDEKYPRHDAQVLDTNRMIADKFANAFDLPDGSLAVPVVPTFGNNDFLPHNIMLPGPNKWFQAYSDIWRHFIPEEQRHSFAFGGWFYVEVIPNRLAVFSLNTMYFFDRNAGVDGCVEPSEPGFKHMEWLRVQLQIMRDRGMKAILMGHVPPARTDNKQLWDETCWQKYTLWLKQYRDVVTGSVYGHMNIDHFLLQDTEDINLSVASGASKPKPKPKGDGISISSKEDYLHDLRDIWSGLPRAAVHASADVGENQKQDAYALSGEKANDGNKHHKYKDIGGKYAERYQLSLISPSIVPNFFPTLRVVEYNITGLDATLQWKDSHLKPVRPFSSMRPTAPEEGDLEHHLETNKKNRNKKEKQKKPHKDPNLIVPEDPPAASLPGPAYYPQTFTFTGYTQYYANLTHINNDITAPDVDGSSKWRRGKHDNKDPKHKKPKPLTFQFEVEYSTFDDKIFKLSDLTVKNYLKLAYRIGKMKKEGKKKSLQSWSDGNEQGSAEATEYEEDEQIEQDTSNDNPKTTKKGKKGKNDKKKKKHRKHKKHRKGKETNKTWLHFLNHAFVSTVPKAELEEM